jgi:hypothetical protein
MKKLERTLIVLCIISFLFAAFNITGRAVLCNFSFSCLALFYLLFTYFLLHDIPFRKMFSAGSYPDTSPQKVGSGIVTGMIFSIATIGSLFVSLHWQGFSFMYFISANFIFVLLIVSILTDRKKRTELTHNRLNRAIGFAIALFILWFVGLHHL